MTTNLNPTVIGDETFADELVPGTPLLHGQYVIEEYLNSGGFGITYLAKDSLHRRVVIKECFPSAFCRRSETIVGVRSRAHASEFKSIVKLFVQEARNLARLRHPNIVGVHQVFEDNDTAYMALDYVEGRDLLDIIEDPASEMEPAHVENLLRKVLEAVKFIHGEGVLHRDISPDNILLTKDNEPVLIDFGAARETATKHSRVLTAMRVVKDGYSPQEFYLSGSDQYPSSDLYALGASVYHLIAGVTPPNSQERLAAVAANDPDPYVPVSARARGFNRGFLNSIDKSLNIFPKDRIQSAAEWIDLLDQAPQPVAPSKPVKLAVDNNTNVEARIQELVRTEDQSEPKVNNAVEPKRKTTSEIAREAKAAAEAKNTTKEISERPQPRKIQVRDNSIKPAPATPAPSTVTPGFAHQSEPRKSGNGMKILLGTAAVLAIAAGVAWTQFRASEGEAERVAVADPAPETPLAPVASEVVPTEDVAAVEAADSPADGSVAPDVSVDVPASAAPLPEAAPEAITLPAEVDLEENQVADELFAPDASVDAFELNSLASVRPAPRPDDLVVDLAATVSDVPPTATVSVIVPQAVAAGTFDAAVGQPEDLAVARFVPGLGEPTVVTSLPRVDLETPLPTPEPEPVVVAEQAPAVTFTPAPAPSSAPAITFLAAPETAPVVENTPEPIPASTAVTRNLTVDLPFLMAASAPGEIAVVEPGAPDWLSPGLELVSVNGLDVSTLAQVKVALAFTLDIVENSTANVIFGLRDPSSGESLVRTAQLNTVYETVLNSGERFHTRMINDAWVTTVKEARGGGENALRRGDVLTALVTTGEAIDGPDTLARIFDREIANGTSPLNFAVNRGGDMWLISMNSAGLGN